MDRLRAKSVALTRYLIGLADAWLRRSASRSPRRATDAARRARHPAPPRALAAQPGADPGGGDRRLPHARPAPARPGAVYTSFADVWDAWTGCAGSLADQAYQDLPRAAPR